MGAASVHECPKQVKPRQLSGQRESAGSGVKMPMREDMACEPEKESKVFEDQ